MWKPLRVSGLILSGLLLVSVYLAFPESGWCGKVLVGKISEETIYRVPGLRGFVYDGETGMPVQGALVTIPSQGMAVKSNNRGAYAIKEMPLNGPPKMIVKIAKQGYAPFSYTIDMGKFQQASAKGSQAPISVQLRRLKKILVIDDNLRHLGDGQYSHVSAGARQFRKQSDGTAYMQQFFLPRMDIAAFPILEIGSILGLDTREAHQNGQSHHHKQSSPVRIRINGREISRIATNGDGHKVQFPKHLLNKNGINTIELETGYHYPDGKRIDYDDMEFMNLLLQL
ncbi:MAG: hypothetical protein KTR14_02755 [Vampirovibrio sp.]|nr:hypothetical protein [Vampirovibrio sp.]